MIINTIQKCVSPVRTAKGSNSSYSLFLLCIQTAKVSDVYYGYSSLKVTYSIHLSRRTRVSSLLWGVVPGDVYSMGCFALPSMTRGISCCHTELSPRCHPERSEGPRCCGCNLMSLPLQPDVRTVEVEREREGGGMGVAGGIAVEHGFEREAGHVGGGEGDGAGARAGDDGGEMDAFVRIQIVVQHEGAGEGVGKGEADGHGGGSVVRSTTTYLKTAKRPVILSQIKM